MIKFFRRIRQQLLSEGNTGKYLKYAIGEIILVVIGILIALQVNNWNEGKKIEQEQLLFLNTLKEDLNNDLEQLDQILTFQQEKLDTINVLKEEMLSTKNFVKNNSHY